MLCDPPVSQPRTWRQGQAGRAPWLQSFIPIGAALLLLMVFGHEGRRVAQLALLALPLPLWLLWPVRNAWAHRLRAGSVWLWAMAFAIDATARAYLLEAYRAAPDAAMVLGAVANASARESTEYLSMYWRSAALGGAALAATGLLVAWCVRRGARWAPHMAPAHTASRRWTVALLGVALLASSIAYASKPWRRLHPALFWVQWGQTAQALRAGWADQQQARDRALARGRAAQPEVTESGPSTVVLVVADSINRDNMSLYGYGRATTPRLLAQKAQLGDRMRVLQDAWSVDASTLPALRNMFRFGLPDSEDPPHLLALARAAGYKVWWISNHDDVAIEQMHGRLADVVDMANRTPGRSSASLDGEILDCVQNALKDTAARKLIVVHLMGAHPHYRLRFPADADNPFDDSVDAVENDLMKHGRPAWVRGFRHEYDAALLYHDFVVSELLQMTRQSGAMPQQGRRAWMYLSDHGQEVGHESNLAGHSPATAAGYRIPAVVWQSGVAAAVAAGSARQPLQPFRADWAGWTLTDLLDIRWQGDMHSRNVLRADYRWQAPSLPVAIESFSD